MYVRDGMIIHKSEQPKHDDFLKWSNAIIVDCKPTDNLIVENWQINIYERSKQYIEDTDKYHLTKENNLLKKENKKLETIANAKVTKELELEKKWQEANSYQRNIYLLKNMRWSQPL